MEGEVSLLKRIVAEELVKIQENEEKESKMEFINMENEIIRLRKQAMEEIEKMQEVKTHLQKRMAEVSRRHKMEAAALRKRLVEEEHRALKLAEEEASLMSLTSESGIPSLPLESALPSLVLEDAVSSLPHEGTLSDSAMSSLTTSNDAVPSLVSESTRSLALDERGAVPTYSAASSQAHAARCRAAALQRAAEAVEAAAERAASRTFPRVEALLAWAAVGKAKGGGKNQGREKRSKNDTPGGVDSPVNSSVIDDASCGVDSNHHPTLDLSNPDTRNDLTPNAVVQPDSIAGEVMDTTPSGAAAASSELASSGDIDTSLETSNVVGAKVPSKEDVKEGENVVGAKVPSKEDVKEGEMLAELDAGSSSMRVNVPSSNRKKGRGRRRR